MVVMGAHASAAQALASCHHEEVFGEMPNIARTDAGAPNPSAMSRRSARDSHPLDEICFVILTASSNAAVA
jgi:hypothetical protein